MRAGHVFSPTNPGAQPRAVRRIHPHHRLRTQPRRQPIASANGGLGFPSACFLFIVSGSLRHGLRSVLGGHYWRSALYERGREKRFPDSFAGLDRSLRCSRAQANEARYGVLCYWNRRKYCAVPLGDTVTWF